MIICDVTESFIRKYLAYSPRTTEQMRQAARSCKQNIVEGITDETVSIEIYIKLIGIAKGSLRELIEDYGDFLRQNKYTVWQLQDPRVTKAREYCKTDQQPESFVANCETKDTEIQANLMLTQCRQLEKMLAELLANIEETFIKECGMKEKISDIRRRWRKDNLGY